MPVRSTTPASSVVNSGTTGVVQKVLSVAQPSMVKPAIGVPSFIPVAVLVMSPALLKNQEISRFPVGVGGIGFLRQAKFGGTFAKGPASTSPPPLSTATTWR